MRTHTLLFGWMTLVVLGCASAAPETTHYLLPMETPAGSAQLEIPVRIGLGRVTVASYLGGPGLAIETRPNEIRSARQHLWAEPLEDGLRRFLRTEISKALGTDVEADPLQQSGWERTIDVGIDRLHGDLEGQARLVAHWRVTPKGGAPSTYRFAATQPLPREGYPGLVDAEIALARQLAGAIAESLRD